MNYIKHVSKVLVVLGIASLNTSVDAAAPAPKIIGWTTPGGTALVADGWAHPDIKAGGKRAKCAVEGTFDAPVLRDSTTARVKLEPVYEAPSLISKLKDIWHNYMGDKATWKSRAVITSTVAVLAAIAYNAMLANEQVAAGFVAGRYPSKETTLYSLY